MHAFLPLLILGLCACPAESQPPWCDAEENLDAPCQGEQCVAAVVVDYKRLEPRGFRVFDPQGQPVDDKQAEQAGADYLTAVRKAELPQKRSVQLEGDFWIGFFVYDENHKRANDNWLLVIHQPTGQVLFAEEEIWADEKKRGYDFALPAGFSSASALGCTEGAGDPQQLKSLRTDDGLGAAPASNPDQAWAVAKRLNLTENFTKGHEYGVLVLSYGPAQGGFDHTSGDWYVWIYRTGTK